MWHTRERHFGRDQDYTMKRARTRMPRTCYYSLTINRATRCFFPFPTRIDSAPPVRFRWVCRPMDVPVIPPQLVYIFDTCCEFITVFTKRQTRARSIIIPTQPNTNPQPSFLSTIPNQSFLPTHFLPISLTAPCFNNPSNILSLTSTSPTSPRALNPASSAALTLSPTPCK